VRKPRPSRAGWAVLQRKQLADEEKVAKEQRRLNRVSTSLAKSPPASTAAPKGASATALSQPSRSADDLSGLGHAAVSGVNLDEVPELYATDLSSYLEPSPYKEAKDEGPVTSLFSSSLFSSGASPSPDSLPTEILGKSPSKSPAKPRRTANEEDRDD
jgi:hypothetical protein